MIATERFHFCSWHVGKLPVHLVRTITTQRGWVRQASIEEAHRIIRGKEGSW